MCLHPKYILNPCLKKINDTHELYGYKPFAPYRLKSLSRLPDGKVTSWIYDNFVSVDSYNCPSYLGSKNLGWQKYIKVPCGKCSECINQKINSMVSRMKIELDKHLNFGYFVTLTYDDAFVPLNRMLDAEGNVTDELVMSLRKSDVQKFLKRLRINLSRSGYDITNFKYFYIGEYGMSTTENKRPHYHLCIFFDDISVPVFSDFVHQSWAFGNIKIDILNESRMRYCATSHATANKLFPNVPGSDKPCSYWSKGFGVPIDKNVLSYIRTHKRVNVSNCDYGLDRFLRSKCFTDKELFDMNRNRLYIKPNEDDDYLKFCELSKKYYPNVSSVEDLSSSQCDFLFSKLNEYKNSVSTNFYNRYVLKRK